MNSEPAAAVALDKIYKLWIQFHITGVNAAGTALDKLNLKAYVSRSSTSTWSPLTLADEGNYETAKRILSGIADLSGLPSGINLRWKITTHDNKNLRLHGVGLTWD